MITAPAIIGGLLMYYYSYLLFILGELLVLLELALPLLLGARELLA